MYHFKKMIESIRTNGIGVTKPVTGDDEAQFLEEKFYEAVEECQHFVFQPLNKDGAMTDAPDGAHPLDAPFRVFSIEMAGQNNYITTGQDTRIAVSCLMAIETSPRRYIVYCHSFDTDNLSLSRVFIYPQASALVQIFIDRLNKEETGVQKIKERFKIGRGQNKRQVEVRRVTYVSPKRELANVKSNYGFAVDWSHRWFVRGHWRDLTPDSLGKNRAGDYCIYGQTWVSEHAKGNPDKEILNKVRIVSP